MPSLSIDTGKTYSITFANNFVNIPVILCSISVGVGGKYAGIVYAASVTTTTTTCLSIWNTAYGEQVSAAIDIMYLATG